MIKDRYISFDWAMKRMLRDKANFAVLEGLLSVLLEQKITIIELLESESNQQRLDDKFNRVDIKALDSNGDIVLIEVQNTREVYYMERILFGAARVISEHMELGSSYKEVKKVYSISILYFDLGSGSDYLYHGHTTFRGVHTGEPLFISDKQKAAALPVPKSKDDIFPDYYLIRVNQFNEVSRTPLEEWISYLKTGVIRDDDTAPGLPEARAKLRYYDMSPSERSVYEEHLNAIRIQNDVIENTKVESREEGRAEGLAEGRAEGREEGFAEGRKEGRVEGMRNANIETAKRMLADGLPASLIEKYTGLTIEEINAGCGA